MLRLLYFLDFNTLLPTLFIDINIALMSNFHFLLFVPFMHLYVTIGTYDFQNSPDIRL